MEAVKCLLVGDSAVGKTPMISTFRTRKFSHEYVPTVADNSSKCLQVDGKLVSLEMWDTSGFDEYEIPRLVTYPGADVFLVCFTLERSSGIERVETKWVPEIQKYCPSTPFILVGTKMDIRDKNCRQKEVIQSKAKGKASTKRIGAANYMECSSLENDGLEEIFSEAIRLALSPNQRRQQNCNIL